MRHGGQDHPAHGRCRWPRKTRSACLGPFGDTGDVYTINFTAPVGGPFTVTTTTAPTTTKSVAQKFAGLDQCRQASASPPAIKGDKLVVTSDTAGTALPYYTPCLTTDVGQVSALHQPSLTTVANIPPALCRRSTPSACRARSGRKDDAYELTVNGRTVPLSSPTGSERDMDAIAINLVASGQCSGSASMGVTATGRCDTGTGSFTLDLQHPGRRAEDPDCRSIQPTVVTNPVAPIYNEHQEPHGFSQCLGARQDHGGRPADAAQRFSANELPSRNCSWHFVDPASGAIAPSSIRGKLEATPPKRGRRKPARARHSIAPTTNSPDRIAFSRAIRALPIALGSAGLCLIACPCRPNARLVATTRWRPE